MRSITSLQNAAVKDILALQAKSKIRREKGVFVCEGLNEIRLCYAAGWDVLEVWFTPKNITIENLINSIQIPESKTEYVEVGAEVFSKIAYREDVQNALALVKIKSQKLGDLKSEKNPLYLVAEKVEKPGNLGALLRTADAAGISAVLLADPLCDLYNPNVIRGSVGCAFTVPVISQTTAEIQQFLAENNVQVFTTFMEESKSVWDCNLAQAAALVVGTESTGLSEAWRKPEFTNINVPMFGKVDSLNVSVAASLLLYEAKRQRQ